LATWLVAAAGTAAVGYISLRFYSGINAIGWVESFWSQLLDSGYGYPPVEKIYWKHVED
jgi:hypothetical protein